MLARSRVPALDWVNQSSGGGGGNFTAATSADIRAGTVNNKGMTPAGYKPLLDEQRNFNDNLYGSWTTANTYSHTSSVVSLANQITGWTGRAFNYNTRTSTLAGNNVDLIPFDNNSIPGGYAYAAVFLASGSRWVIGTSTNNVVTLYKLVSNAWVLAPDEDAAYIWDTNNIPNDGAWYILPNTGRNSTSTAGIDNRPAMIRNVSGTLESWTFGYSSGFQIRRSTRDLAISSTPAANSITRAMLQNDIVNQDKIADDSIRSEHINTGAINSDTMIADRTISTLKIGVGAVNWGEIANNAVRGQHINSGAINNSNKFSSGVVNAAAIGANAVGSSELADNAVDLGAINAGSGTAGQVLARNTANTGLDWVTPAASSGGDEPGFETHILFSGSVTTSTESTAALRYSQAYNLSFTSSGLNKTGISQVRAVEFTIGWPGVAKSETTPSSLRIGAPSQFRRRFAIGSTYIRSGDNIIAVQRHGVEFINNTQFRVFTNISPSTATPVAHTFSLTVRAIVETVPTASVVLSSIDAGTGTAGQVLARNSANTALDWITPASGGTPADGSITAAKLASNAVTLPKISAGSGTAGQVLARNSANNGLDWITPASGGSSATPTFLNSGLNAITRSITGAWTSYDYISLGIVTRTTGGDDTWVTWPIAYFKSSQMISGFSATLTHRPDVRFSYVSGTSYSIALSNVPGGSITYHTLMGWN